MTGRSLTVTAKQYLACLKRLGLTPASKRTAAALGLSLGQCQKIAAGRSGISGPLEKLLAMYLKHGIPEEEDD